MSSSGSEFSDDEYYVEYEYENYTIECYKSGNGPPLISKKARIIAATTQNDVETLRQLLSSKKWCTVRDKNDLTLIQIAVFRENEEVFNFLQSFDKYQPQMGDFSVSSRYAFELSLKKVVDVNARVDAEGNTLLHCAVRRDFIKAMRLLIERGADLNAQNERGKTPLHMCLETAARSRDEATSMLLYYGADPLIHDIWDLTPFDEALSDWTRKWDITSFHEAWYGWSSWDLISFDPRSGWWSRSAEILFYFTVDEWSLYEAPGWSLLKLAHNFKSAFKQVIELSSDVIYSDDMDSSSCFNLLITLESECLQILLEKYPCFVKQVLQSYSERSYFDKDLLKQFDLKNFDMLIQSSLSLDVIELISKVDSSRFVECLQGTGKSKDEILEIIYYFLSYGMCLHERALENIYKITSYTEDFKNLLLMDVQKQSYIQISEMMPRLIYDITLDFHKSLESPYSCDINIDWGKIFQYFHHPTIQNAYFVIKGTNYRHISQIPLLKELARDAFRKHFIKIFEIKTAKQFYCLLRKLPVSSVYKKIITFETRLY